MKKKPLEYALYLLELRDRTESEIRNKMRMKKYDQADIETAIKFLSEKDFINDKRFVENYIQNKQEFGAVGKYKIRQKLILLGLDQKLIEENLVKINSESEFDHAHELAQNWLKKHQKDEKTYQKLGSFLARKGFEIDIVKEVLAETLKK